MTTPFDELMRHKIFLQRLGLGQAKDILTHVVDVRKPLLKHIKSSKGIIKVSELNKITKDIEKQLQNSLYAKAYPGLVNFSKYETKFNMRILNKVFRGKLLTPKEQAVIDNFLDKGMALSAHGKKLRIDKVYDLLGATIATDYNKNIRKALVNIDMQIQQAKKEADVNRVGILTESLYAADSGIILSRAKSIGVTIINHISHSTMDSIYTENEDIIGLLRWDTMLDDFVCPDCEDLEGQEWELGEQTEEPPLHAQCRCVLAPEEIFGKNSSDTTKLKGS